MNSVHNNGGTLNADLWLKKILENRDEQSAALLKQTLTLATIAADELVTPYGGSVLGQGFAMSEILNDLRADSTTIAAALLYSSAQFADLSADDITENTNANVAKLVTSTRKLTNVSDLYKVVATRELYQQNLDNIRKMLLAMVDDIRIVLIKLAEQLYILRKAANFAEKEKRQIAEEVAAIYAPLANRLGMVRIKWELEDLSFHYLEPEKYQEISDSLKQTKPERDQYIKDTIVAITSVVEKSDVKTFQITGRAKHIYSIHRKMARKQVGIADIYDASAFRILVHTIEDCYKALSAVHSVWEHIPKEFDDYVTHPKPNGYRSIHTAVIGPQGKVVEIQIRTYEMHGQAELGMAAHWVYKEGATQKSRYETKIAWLRQLMDWQSEISAKEQTIEEIKKIFSDRVYVFTPQGDIFDLPTGATPLDFAYAVHSEIGHRCCGAKVNGNIVPLIYKLHTGEYVEILTAKNGKPSRDWLNPDLGYLKSPRAKAKILSWFKKQSIDTKAAYGQDLLNKELRRLGIKQIDFDEILKHLNYKSKGELLAALGSGEIKTASIIEAAAGKALKPAKLEIPPIPEKKLPKQAGKRGDLNIQGIDNLLVSIASCCKPLPGEKIIGYITRAHSISIHKEECASILYARKMRPERIIFVKWSETIAKHYPASIKIKAFDRSGLVRDISNVIADEEMTIINLNLDIDKKTSSANIALTIEISSLDALSKVLAKISHISGVLEAKKV